MTFEEYHIRCEAYKLQAVDRQYQLHAQAFLNYSVQAQRSVGKYKSKPVYNRFEKFFDYKKELAKAQGKEMQGESRFKGIGKVLSQSHKKQE